MLFFLSVFYVLMAVYWGIVFVGGPGTHRFYFPFQPSYWLGPKKRESSTSDPADPETGEAAVEGAIKVDSLCKLYGSTEAVSTVSLQMAKGEITALLGHVRFVSSLFVLGVECLTSQMQLTFSTSSSAERSWEDDTRQRFDLRSTALVW